MHDEKRSGSAVRALRGRNRALIALQRGRRRMITAAISRPREALTTEQDMTF